MANFVGETPGETIMHESNEAYIGTVDSPGGNFNNSYKQSHTKAAQLDRVQPPNFAHDIKTRTDSNGQKYYDLYFLNLQTNVSEFIQSWYP